MTSAAGRPASWSVVARSGEAVIMVPVVGVGRVLVPEPLHAGAPQPIAGGELLIGADVERRVGDRVEEHLAEETYVAALLGGQREGGRHVAADRVTGHDHAGGVQAVVSAVRDDPPGRGVVL